MNSSSIERLFKKHSVGCVYLAKKISGEVFCEDVVSDVFEKLMLIDVDEYVAEKMLYIMVRNAAVNLKNNKRSSNIDISVWDDESDYYSDQTLIQAELISLLTDKYKSLPEERKKVFDLVFLRRLSNTEAAMILNLSPSTIGVQKKRLADVFKVFGGGYFSNLVKSCK